MPSSQNGKSKLDIFKDLFGVVSCRISLLKKIPSQNSKCVHPI